LDDSLDAVQEDASVVEGQGDPISMNEEVAEDVGNEDVSELATVPSLKEKGSGACSITNRVHKTSLLLAVAFIFSLFGFKKRRSSL
jgi:hypothetical protein